MFSMQYQVHVQQRATLCKSTHCFFPCHVYQWCTIWLVCKWYNVHVAYSRRPCTLLALAASLAAAATAVRSSRQAGGRRQRVESSRRVSRVSRVSIVSSARKLTTEKSARARQDANRTTRWQAEHCREARIYLFIERGHNTSILQ